MSAFVLKIIASLCMLIDHIGAVFQAPVFFRFIGRVAFPIYAYMIAQGCRRSKNLWKYLLRLGVFALISEIPFDMAFWSYMQPDHSMVWDINFTRYTNVFFTLALGVACVLIYEGIKRKRRQWLALLPLPAVPAILLVNYIPALSGHEMRVAQAVLLLYTAGALCLARFLPNAEGLKDIPLRRRIIPILAALPLLATAGALKTDYDVIGVALIFCLYLANPDSKLRRTVVLAAGMAYLYGGDLISTSGDFVNGVFTVISREPNWIGFGYLAGALAAVGLLLFYNGKQGRRVKWAFYVFYPAHILALVIVRFLVYPM